MAIDREKWLKRLEEMNNKKEDIKKHKKAEKILIAYENPKISIKWALFYRYVTKLDGFYSNTYIDELGFEIGILRNLIFNNQETFVSESRRFSEMGWIFEQGATLNNIPVVENLLKRENIIE